MTVFLFLTLCSSSAATSDQQTLRAAGMSGHRRDPLVIRTRPTPYIRPIKSLQHTKEISITATAAAETRPELASAQKPSSRVENRPSSSKSQLVPSPSTVIQIPSSPLNSTPSFDDYRTFTRQRHSDTGPTLTSALPSATIHRFRILKIRVRTSDEYQRRGLLADLLPVHRPCAVKFGDIVDRRREILLAFNGSFEGMVDAYKVLAKHRDTLEVSVAHVNDSGLRAKWGEWTDRDLRV